MPLSCDQLIAQTNAYFISNGELIAFIDGAHVSLGARDNNTGAFELTELGTAISNSADPVIDIQAIAADVAAEEAEPGPEAGEALQEQPTEATAEAVDAGIAEPVVTLDANDPNASLQTLLAD